ncbi:hypothetical protein JM49_15835 [Pseudomonas chlororaphis subsp. aurantiaca]|nr:hypothetical protein JM49_15835 [Pseudomonas chlororaphis subsp. aurantiaca]
MMETVQRKHFFLCQSQLFLLSSNLLPTQLSIRISITQQRVSFPFFRPLIRSSSHQCWTVSNIGLVLFNLPHSLAFRVIEKGIKLWFHEVLE